MEMTALTVYLDGNWVIIYRDGQTFLSPSWKTDPKKLYWAGVTAHILTLLLIAKTSEHSCEKLSGDSFTGGLKPRLGSRLEINFQLE